MHDDSNHVVVNGTNTTATTTSTVVSAAGAIVVVAKCPIPGQSKTRLSKLLGTEGSAVLAKSMLLDVLQQIGLCVSKV